MLSNSQIDVSKAYDSEEDKTTSHIHPMILDYERSQQASPTSTLTPRNILKLKQSFIPAKQLIPDVSGYDTLGLATNFGSTERNPDSRITMQSKLVKPSFGLFNPTKLMSNSNYDQGGKQQATQQQ
jgi:hypothetical protein